MQWIHQQEEPEVASQEAMKWTQRLCPTEGTSPEEDSCKGIKGEEGNGTYAKLSVIPVTRRGI